MSCCIYVWPKIKEEVNGHKASHLHLVCTFFLIFFKNLVFQFLNRVGEGEILYCMFGTAGRAKSIKISRH